MHSFTTEKLTGLSRAIVLAFTLAAPLVSSSCATEPPPKPAQFDPANPGAAESKPLEVSSPASLDPVSANGETVDAGSNSPDPRGARHHPEKTRAPPPARQPHAHRHAPR